MNPHAIGVTATQVGLTNNQKADALAWFMFLKAKGFKELHHGDCIGGDADLHEIGREVGFWIVGHPPMDPSKRAWKVCDRLMPKLPYLDRNHRIVESTAILLGFPKGADEMLRSGTWATIRYARRRQRPHEIIPPNYEGEPH